MADVKWIKIAVNIFDSRKIKQIECLPDGDGIIAIWLKILCLAGIVNDCGTIYLTKDVPYTEQMLSVEFNRPLPLIQMALRVFQQFRMIDIVDDFIHVTNWEKYQNIDGMERIREQTRQRVAAHRVKARLPEASNVTRNVTVTQRNATDKEEERDIDKESKKALPRHAHGENGWVKLTDKELASLVEKHGQALVDYYIQYIDESAQISRNKNKWQDWNRVIQKAIREKWGKPPAQSSTIKVFDPVGYMEGK